MAFSISVELIKRAVNANALETYKQIREKMNMIKFRLWLAELLIGGCEEEFSQRECMWQEMRAEFLRGVAQGREQILHPENFASTSNSTMTTAEGFKGFK